ncbi:MAG TPA: hypothetical protein VHP33_25940 [Polyangiaceae bacterium]|nr:hypothetical protein [Polyangiaceae bacterium]
MKQLTAAALFRMSNGTPCLIYDGAIPHVHTVEFCRDDHLLTLVWTDPGSAEDCRLQMEYPVSEECFLALEQFGIVAVGHLKAERSVDDLHIAPVVFTAA